jgi:hypothetical protein
MPKKKMGEPPHDVRAILIELEKALNILDFNGKRVGDAKHGVYAFYDYDGEPIYVGQTFEKLRVRIRRHLTNKRTDAVAMNVLDPFEVADIEMWAFWTLAGQPRSEVKDTLASAEYTVFQKLLAGSTFGAVLNEVPVTPAPTIALPKSVRQRIVPELIYEQRKHPDIRVARRAGTIAKLAQVISERSVQAGLRNTLLTQARRLEHLAAQRLDEVGGPAHPGEPSDPKER